MRLISLLAVALVVLVTSHVSVAQDSLSFQGYLTDDLGNPIDEKVQLSFTLYKDGSSVWTETQSTVTVTGGVFDVLLGSVTPLDTVAFVGPMEVGISVNGGSEISPRTPLAGTAHALSVRGMHAYWADNGTFQSYNVVGGAPNNSAGPSVVGATISGGGGFQGLVDRSNSVDKQFGTIGGGYSNTVSGQMGVINGGAQNEITTAADFGVINGGFMNTVDEVYGVIGGGQGNLASNNYATISGGWGSEATGIATTVVGGWDNEAHGAYSTVLGGRQNATFGLYSAAGGYNASVLHDGSFLWADRSVTGAADSIATTGDNQFIIRAVGGVGVGTNSPDAPLDVASGNNWNLVNTEGDFRIGNDTYRMKFGIAIGGGGAGTSRIHATGGTGRVIIGGNDTDVVRIDSTNGVHPGSDNGFPLGSSSWKWTEVWATDGAIKTSDRRLKQDIADLSYGLDAVKELRPVRYRWKDRPADGDRLGLIAQETAQVIPEVVEVPDDPEEYLGMRYSELVPVLVRAIQQQQEIIESQARTISDQNERLEAVESQIFAGSK